MRPSLDLLLLIVSAGVCVCVCALLGWSCGRRTHGRSVGICMRFMHESIMRAHHLDKPDPALADHQGVARQRSEYALHALMCALLCLFTAFKCRCPIGLPACPCRVFVLLALLSSPAAPSAPPQACYARTEMPAESLLAF